jgi:hypothetical protein
MIYNGEFTRASDVFDAFEVSADDRKDCIILYASYDIDGYDGSAHVIFYKDENLYEVNGGHCSCYGLEGQWDPEIIDLEVIRGKAARGVRAYGADYGHFLKNVAEELECSVEILTVKQIAMLAVLKG